MEFLKGLPLLWAFPALIICATTHYWVVVSLVNADDSLSYFELFWANLLQITTEKDTAQEKDRMSYKVTLWEDLRQIEKIHAKLRKFAPKRDSLK